MKSTEPGASACSAPAASEPSPGGRHDVDRARDEFLSVASRELRNALMPLTSLVEYLDGSVQRAPEAVPERIARMIGRLSSATHHFAARASLLFEATRLMAGLPYGPVPSAVDLSRLVRDALALAGPSAELVGSTLDVAIEDGVVVVSDHDALAIVADVLLSNAVKYGAGHPIGVTLRHVGPAGGTSAEFSVQDRGIGIASGDLDRVFAAFERAHGGPTSGGFGVGLWVARDLCAALGGTLRVESTLGLGSRFVATLPLCVPER